MGATGWGGGPQGDGDPLGLSGISGREVLPRLRVTPNRWGVVSALGGVENRLGPGVSAAGEPGNTAGEVFSSAPGRAAAAQSLRLSSLPSPSGCSVPRSGLPAPPSCSTPAERLFWQNMPSRGHNCLRKTFPLLFPGTALGSFQSGVVTKARGCGHSGSDDGTPFASALRAPSGQSFTFPTAELQQLVLGTLSRLQDQPHGATREPKGVLLPWCPLLVTPYNLCTFVFHHWTDTLVVVGQTLVGKLPAPSPLCDVQGSGSAHHTFLSGLCSSRQVCPTSLEECLSSLVRLQYHTGGSSN